MNFKSYSSTDHSRLGLVLDTVIYGTKFTVNYGVIYGNVIIIFTVNYVIKFFYSFSFLESTKKVTISTGIH